MSVEYLFNFNLVMNAPKVLNYKSLLNFDADLTEFKRFQYLQYYVWKTLKFWIFQY